MHLPRIGRRLLFPEASDKQFGDVCVQTVTFALQLTRHRANQS
ncbi:hypothetical protein BH20ACT1_BH20ACT1_07970 [soil metagenome]